MGWKRKISDVMVLITFAVAFAGAMAVVSATEPTHYPPSASNINNLTFVFSGSGAPGIFNSSSSPNSKYGVYNWCNAACEAARIRVS